MADVWKTGGGVPARKAGGGAHRAILDVIHELVMAMGWTRASQVAQDLANALIWKLYQLVNAACEPLVAEARRLSPEFEAAWRVRLAIPHDEYGSHAMLASALI